jgi:hypothetical protein
VIRLLQQGLTVTEIAPGVDLRRDVLAQAAIELQVADSLKLMDARLFRPEPMGLELQRPRRKSPGLTADPFDKGCRIPPRAPLATPFDKGAG